MYGWDLEDVVDEVVEEQGEALLPLGRCARYLYMYIYIHM